ARAQRAPAGVPLELARNRFPCASAVQTGPRRRFRFSCTSRRPRRALGTITHGRRLHWVGRNPVSREILPAGESSGIRTRLAFRADPTAARGIDLDTGCVPEESSMSRLVCISNRISLPRRSAAPGGLAVGILSALKRTGGLWFGWRGETI